MLTTRPATHAHRRPEGRVTGRLGGSVSGFEGERNEIADFIDERAETVARRVLCFLAQLLGVLQRTLATIEERANVHGCWRGGGARRGSPGGPPPSPPSPGEQVVQGCRSHASRHEALVRDP